MSRPIEIDGDAFAAARTLQRTRTRADRAAARAAAQAARIAFLEDAEVLYASPVGPADADILEDIAERVLAFARELAPLLDALAVARDQAVWRGAIQHRIRSRLDESDLAELVGESVSHAMLSDAAAALVGAAIRAAA